MQIDPYLTPGTKFCTKQTKEIDRSPDTLERIEESGECLEFIGTGKYLWQWTAITKEQRTRANKWNLVKPKKLFY